MELYNERKRTRDKSNADRKFIIDVLLLFRPGMIKPLAENRNLNHYDMLKSYFKIGWRNLSKQKMYSAIKIGGFAVGIAACLLIALFIREELNYDLHYAHGDRIYRIVRRSQFRGEFGNGVHFPAPFTKALQEDISEFEKVGRYNPVGNFGAGSNEVRRIEQLESTHENGFTYFDQGLLDILEIPFVNGSPQHALTEPNTMVITQSVAHKYFGQEDPIGKVFVLNNDEGRQYTVTGVIRDFPLTSHLQYDFLMTPVGKEIFKGEQTNWRTSNHLNYVFVREGADIPTIERKMHAMLKTYFLPFAIEKGANGEELDWLNSMSFDLQPVRDIYLNKMDVRDDLRHGDIRYIWLFGAIAAFILLIACINFINLSTARSAGRAREVGLRKVVGSHRGSLVNQFLVESLLFSLCSFVLGVFLAWAFLPYFNLLLAKSLNFPGRELWFIPVLGTGMLVVGIVAGLYPAFYLSSFSPAQVLKGNTAGAGKNTTLRSFLVVFQFSVSIVLIVGTFVINRQMNYILNKNLGFDKDQVLLLEGTHTLGDKIVTFKNELLRLSEVKYVSISGYIPVAGAKRNGGPMRTEGMAEEDRVSSQHWAVDHDYVKTMGLKIIQGRDFSVQMRSDSQAIIINESLAKALQLKEPIGSRIFNWAGGWTVIGVVEDFHTESLKQVIQPMGLFIRRSNNTVSVKISTTDMPAAIESITKVWKEFSPHQPIRFNFLDERYAHMYDDVGRMGRIFSSFAILAIVVACLGLFALSAYTAEQRGKEISIRLVLGASLQNIFNLLTLNFVKLVLISIIIAVPVSWYVMQEWLADFSYKVAITWDMFALAGLAAVVIALMTISYQSIRAAFRNPVESLKAE